MKTRQKIATIVLVLLLGTIVYGLIRTTTAPSVVPSQGKGKNASIVLAPQVDQSPLRTAQKLAQFADNPEEQALSKEAIRLCDHELDLAYESARRDVEAHPRVRLQVGPPRDRRSARPGQDLHHYLRWECLVRKGRLGVALPPQHRTHR